MTLSMDDNPPIIYYSSGQFLVSYFLLHPAIYPELTEGRAILLYHFRLIALLAIHNFRSLRGVGSFKLIGAMLNFMEMAHLICINSIVAFLHSTHTRLMPQAQRVSLTGPLLISALVA